MSKMRSGAVRVAMLAFGMLGCDQKDASTVGGERGNTAGAGRGQSQVAGSSAPARGGSSAETGQAGDSGRAGASAAAGAAGSTAGGGAMPRAGTTAQPMAADYFPMSDGASWTYRHLGGSTTWDEVVKQSSVMHKGKPAVLLEDNPGPSGTNSKTILAAEGPRILRVHRDEFSGMALQLSADYAPGFLRYNRDWQKESAGFVEMASYSRTEYDAMQRPSAAEERGHRFSIEALDDAVQVVAGTFDDCLRVRRSRVRAAGAAVREGDEDLFWFCPGIGKVKELDQATGKSEELVSCSIPGGACPSAN